MYVRSHVVMPQVRTAPPTPADMEDRKHWAQLMQLLQTVPLQVIQSTGAIRDAREAVDSDPRLPDSILFAASLCAYYVGTMGHLGSAAGGLQASGSGSTATSRASDKNSVTTHARSQDASTAGGDRSMHDLGDHEQWGKTAVVSACEFATLARVSASHGAVGARALRKGMPQEWLEWLECMVGVTVPRGVCEVPVFEYSFPV